MAASVLGTVTHGNSVGIVASFALSHTVDASTAVLLLNVYTWVTAGAYTVDTVTWNSASATLRSTRTNGQWRIQLWELLTPTPGTGDIVVTPSISVEIATGGLNVGGVQTPTYWRGTMANVAVNDNGSSIVITDESGDLGYLLGGESRANNGAPIANNTTHAGTIGAVTTHYQEVMGGSNGANQMTCYTFPFTLGPTTQLTQSSSLFRAGGQIGFAFLDAVGGGVSIPVVMHHLRQQQIA